MVEHWNVIARMSIWISEPVLLTDDSDLFIDSKDQTSNNLKPNLAKNFKNKNGQGVKEQGLKVASISII